MKEQRSWLVCFWGVCLTVFLVAEAVWTQSTKSESAPLSEKAKRGKLVFQDACFLCHDRDNEQVKPLGPSLDGLFKRQALIVGRPVNEGNVKEVIKMGPTPGMPGFRYMLSEEEMDDLVEFLKTK